MELTREQLIECYDCVFNSIHSPGFKEGEMKDLIYSPDYQFIEQPKDNWKDNLCKKLNEIGFDLKQLNKGVFKNYDA